MKQSLYILIPLLLLINLISCNKADDTDSTMQPSVTQPQSHFQATVNGTVMHADSARGYMFVDTTAFPFPWRGFDVVGWKQGIIKVVAGYGDTINSWNPSIVNLDSLQAGAAIGYNDFSNNDYEPLAGEFEITSVDTVNHLVSGTFSGINVGDISHDTIVITNGSFTNIIYGPL
jgi:hypothetical protein